MSTESPADGAGRALRYEAAAAGAIPLVRALEVSLAGERIRRVPLPTDPFLGPATLNVGLVRGGVAPNVVSPHASAELLFRTVGDGAPIRSALRVVEVLVTIEFVLDVPAVRLHVVGGFETAVFPYTTDVPLLTRWGRPLLIGPGSIHVAHTDEEHLAIDELHEAIDIYESLARRLLADREA